MSHPYFANIGIVQRKKHVICKNLKSLVPSCTKPGLNELSGIWQATHRAKASVSQYILCHSRVNP